MKVAGIFVLHDPVMKTISQRANELNIVLALPTRLTSCRYSDVLVHAHFYLVYAQKLCKSLDNSITTLSYVSFYREAALRRIFSRYDRDGNGRIDRQELGAILKEMGKVFSDAEVYIIVNSTESVSVGLEN